jgi:hypothetical protein
LKNLNKKIALFAWMWFPLVLFAQGDASFEAYSDARQVVLNGFFEVSFTLKNANGSDFIPPDFKGFVVLSGPNTAMSTSIVNGRVSKEMSYSFMLQPKAAGKFTISSASIKANGNRLTTQPLNIEVVRGKTEQSPAAGKSEDIFIQLEPGARTAYVGEQILLDYKLYTTLSIESYDIPVEPDYLGFYATELRRYDARTQREVVGGKQYTTKVMRRVALFPQQTGPLTIPSTAVQMTVMEGNDPTGFFFRRNIRPLVYTTDPVTIEVKPLPDNAPPGFSGAVGKYEFQASVNRRMATTDDAVTITVLISGNGDLKRVQPPDLLLSDSFEIYPPKVLEETTTENQGEVIGRKVLEYLALPKFPGEYVIEPVFSYFDPQAENYVTLESEPYVVIVRQGSDRHIVKENKEKPGKVETDIRFIKLTTKLKKPGTSFLGSASFWGLVTLPVLAFIGVFFYRQARDRKESLDHALLKSQRAGKEARKRLALAQTHLLANNSRAFYDEVSKASLGYVCDKLSIPLSELSKENVREKLASLNVGDSLTEEFIRILQTCEMALFAGMDNAPAMQSTYDKAIATITGIEEQLTDTKKSQEG